MKKRFAASTVLMSTALVLGTTTAWAETSTGESTAKITFTTNEAPVIVDPESPDPTKPYDPIYDPDNPDTDPDGNGNTPTGNTGPLTLDYAPNFDFGSNELLSNKAEFNATDQKPFLQVTDRRVNRTEWEVTVKLGDFIDEGGKPSLIGSTLSIDAGTVQTLVNVSGFTAPTTGDITLTPGNAGDAQTILTSPEGTFSTWQIYWKGNGTDNDYIKLNVPINSQVEGTHIATLDWTLTDVVN